MRYYDIQVGAVASTGTAGAGGGVHYTSHPQGVQQPPDPGALQIEMDIVMYAADATDIQSWVRVWGIPLSDIAQARDLNGQNITIKGGMGKGLPLANPAQAGTLVSCQVNQCFGNWVDTRMTLDFQLRGGGPPTPGPGDVNIVHDWRKGQPIGPVIKTALTTAFPAVGSIAVDVLDTIVAPADEQGYYRTIQEYFDYLKGVSQAIVNPKQVSQTVQPPQGYAGISGTVYPDGSIYVSDGTKQQSAKQIAFVDLIGQPTWIEVNTIMVTCAMRSDIRVFDLIKLPPSQVTVTTGAFSAFSSLRQSSIFQGTWRVSQVRHVGNFKQPSAEAWVTHITCVGPEQTTASGQSSPSKFAPSGTVIH